MWWLAIPPAVAVGAYVVKKIFEDEEENYTHTTVNYTHLESNFQKLEKILFNNSGIKK